MHTVRDGGGGLWKRSHRRAPTGNRAVIIAYTRRQINQPDI